MLQSIIKMFSSKSLSKIGQSPKCQAPGDSRKGREDCRRRSCRQRQTRRARSSRKYTAWPSASNHSRGRTVSCVLEIPSFMGRCRTALDSDALKNNAHFQAIYHVRPLPFDCAYHYLTYSFHLIANHAATCIPTFNFVSSIRARVKFYIRTPPPLRHCRIPM